MRLSKGFDRPVRKYHTWASRVHSARVPSKGLNRSNSMCRPSTVKTHSSGGREHQELSPIGFRVQDSGFRVQGLGFCDNVITRRNPKEKGTLRNSTGKYLGFCITCPSGLRLLNSTASSTPHAFEHLTNPGATSPFWYPEALNPKPSTLNPEP